MHYFFLLLLFLGGCVNLCAQDVAAVNYGLESAMQTNKIYHIYYSKKDLLYICTDNGLWSYDGLVFKKYPLSNQKNIGLTNVQEDEDGRIFVRDFRGNIYRLNEAEKLDPYSFPPLVKGEIAGFKIIKDTKYFYTNQQIFCERANGEWVEVELSLDIKFVIDIVSNGIVELSNGNDNKFYLYKLVDTICKKLPAEPTLTRDKFKKNYEDSWCLLTPKNQIFDDQGDLLVDLSLAPSKLFPIKVSKIKEHLLVACGNGLYEAGTNQVFFKDQYITGVEEDREGNIWVSTLNGGIYKIHKLGYQVYPIDHKNQGADVILVHGDHVVYSDLMGNLYKNSSTKTAFECFYTNTERSTVKNLLFDSESQHYISSGGEYNIFDTTFKHKYHVVSYGRVDLVEPLKYMQTRKSSSIHFNLGVKDIRESYALDKVTKKKLTQVGLWEDTLHKINLVERSDGEKYFYSLNSAVRLSTLWKDELIYWLNDSLFFLNVNNLKHRNMGYYPNLQNLWIRNNQFFALDSVAFLELDRNGQIRHSIRLQKGMEEGIYYVSVNEHYICLSTKNGMHILETDSLTYKYKFGAQNGIASVDFVKGWVYGHYLYVNGSKGVSKIDLQSSYDQGQPLLTLAYVSIDSQQQKGQEFAHDQNNIELLFDVKSYTAGGHIQWRINERNWQTLSSSNRIILNDLQSGQYRIEAFFKNDLGATSDTAIYHFSIDKPYWQKLWFWVLISAGIGCGAWWWYQRRLQQIQAKNNLENQLIASQMTALKSQMNPHFIFNALNSIQSLVRFNKNKEAYKYINKFALLLRETLHYSDKDFIPLEREISLLQNYLDMEKMRFDEELDFSIQANCSTNIQIPSMIIQPFVENAIKHGLLHKTHGQKQLWVIFEEKDENSLRCIVWDNGIGRVRAREIAANQKRIGTSFSTQATQKRLELLQELQHSQLGVSYIDLYNDAKQAIGTKVELVIPVD